VFPEDDLRIKTFRGHLKWFNVKMLHYYNITVHLLVCDKLSVYKMHGATIKIIVQFSLCEADMIAYILSQLIYFSEG